MTAPDGGHAGASGPGSSEGGTRKPPKVTTAEIRAMALLSVLMLVGGIVVGGSFGDGLFNYEMRARDVGGLVMPPGMIRGVNPSVESMKDMAAVDASNVRFTATQDARGDGPLEPTIDGNAKIFRLNVSIIRWNILHDVQVLAYAFNDQVPGPRIRVTEGDLVRIIVKNDLPEPTSVHWHGLILPNGMDGVGDITQRPIQPGETYTYEFTPEQKGTYFYHSHTNADRQQTLGMYGAFIIDPKAVNASRSYDREVVVQLGEWTQIGEYTFPAMDMVGVLPNYFTINGKAYPDTASVDLKVGERLLVRFVGTNTVGIHPMHIHGGPFKLVATDGNAVPPGAEFLKDTVNVGPGERYDVIWTAREPGTWLLHCHIDHHVTNNNVEEQGAGGLTMLLNVTTSK